MRKPREHDYQKLIVDALRLAGFTVYHTTAYRQKGGSGVSKGIPDLLVVHPCYDYCYIGLEVKLPGKEARFSSNEQKEAAMDRLFAVVSSPKMALDVMLDQPLSDSQRDRANRAMEALCCQ